jgi:hypothetical protein
MLLLDFICLQIPGVAAATRGALEELAVVALWQKQVVLVIFQCLMVEGLAVAEQPVMTVLAVLPPEAAVLEVAQPLAKTLATRLLVEVVAVA